jgi:glycosyltransferase involved in cell wall biosynthesis
VVCEQNAANSGAHYSLNRGLALAEGEYLFPLNSDDRYHPLRLASMIDAMQAQDRRFAFSAVNPFCAPGGQVHEGLLHLIGFLDFNAPRLPSLSFAFLRYNCALSTGNFAIRRDLFRQVGGFVDLKLAHDWDYVLRVIPWEEPLYVATALYEDRKSVV